MSPPISKDWWLAAALSSATLPGAMAQPAANTPPGRQTGVVTTTVVQGTQRTVTSAPIYVEAASNQRLITGPNQSLHVLFSDQSAITLGPNSNVVISEYRYDAQAKAGRLLMNMTRGLLRVVGGFISKRTATTVVTPTSTAGIRGGISIMEVDDKGTRGTFLFGQSMHMTRNDGSGEQAVTRPGFGLRFGGDGPTQPLRIPASELNTLLAFFERPTDPGGLGFLNQQQPNPGAPGGAPVGQINQVAVDRVAPTLSPNDTPGLPGAAVPNGDLPANLQPPSLSTILGSQGLGNQS